MKHSKRSFLKKTILFLGTILTLRISIPSFKIITKNIYKKFDKKNNLVWILKRND